MLDPGWNSRAVDSYQVELRLKRRLHGIATSKTGDMWVLAKRKSLPPAELLSVIDYHGTGTVG